MIKSISVALVCLLMAACGHAQTTVSLQQLDCGSCSPQVLRLLEKEDGVRATRFSLALAEVTVTHDPERTPPAQLVEILNRAGFAAVLGAGKGSYESGPDFDPGLDVRPLTKTGQRVDLQQARAAGKVTVIDFGAAWCAPCRELDKFMATLLKSRTDLAVRKVDIVDWDSPVAAQHLRDVKELPYILVYAPDGRQVAAITGLKREALAAAIEEAAR